MQAGLQKIRDWISANQQYLAIVGAAGLGVFLIGTVIILLIIAASNRNGGQVAHTNSFQSVPTIEPSAASSSEPTDTSTLSTSSNSSSSPLPEPVITVQWIHTDRTYYVTSIEPTEQAYNQVDITVAGVAKLNCSIAEYKIQNSQRNLVETKNVDVFPGGTYGQPFYFAVGSYEFEAHCTTPDGRSYTNVIRSEVTAAPVSSCDTKDFDFTQGTYTFDEAKTAILGTWRGCADKPAFDRTGFEVEMIFTADGKYQAQNIEKAIRPDTKRTFPAMYVGNDDVTPDKMYELNNILSDGSAEGDIYIVGNLSQLRSVKFNADKTKLYLETLYNSQRAVYELERVP